MTEVGWFSSFWRPSGLSDAAIFEASFSIPKKKHVVAVDV